MVPYYGLNNIIILRSCHNKVTPKMNFKGDNGVQARALGFGLHGRGGKPSKGGPKPKERLRV